MSTPPIIAVPIVTVAMVAGSGWAISRRTVIPAVDRGANCLARAVGAIAKRPTAPPLHGKRVAPDLLVWAVGALAEGLGIRAVARVCEVDPNTVLQWLVEVADHAVAFSQYFLHDVRVTQVQLDELFALLSAVKAGEVSDAEAIQRLSRSPHWVWAVGALAEGLGIRAVARVFEVDPNTVLQWLVEAAERWLSP